MEPPVAPGHVGRGPGLTDEDEVLRIEIELAFEPGVASLQDVGTFLFGGMRRLLRVSFLDGPINREAFEAYVARVLVADLRANEGA